MGGMGGCGMGGMGGCGGCGMGGCMGPMHNCGGCGMGGCMGGCGMGGCMGGGCGNMNACTGNCSMGCSGCNMATMGSDGAQVLMRVMEENVFRCCLVVPSFAMKAFHGFTQPLLTIVKTQHLTTPTPIVCFQATVLRRYQKILPNTPNQRPQNLNPNKKCNLKPFKTC